MKKPTKRSTPPNIRDLPGLGLKSEEHLAAVGVDSVEALMISDPYVIYQRLKQRYPSTSLNFLYAIMGAQQGCTWLTIAQSQKTEILLRLDDMGLAP